MAIQKKNTRRSFISKTVKGSLAIGASLSIAAPLLQSFTRKENYISSKFNTGFDQQALPYTYDGLENIIDAMTMEIHYSKHAAAYSKNAKEAATAEGVNIALGLEPLLCNISKYSPKMRNNGGGHYNHEMFWKCMRAKQVNNLPTGDIQAAINLAFGSFEDFKKKFSDTGKNRFGSGWAWLYIDGNKKLQISSTPNQDNPLMDVSDKKGFPLLALDVWEHAYYLKYQNKRADYIQNWWDVVNWDYVQQRMGDFKI